MQSLTFCFREAEVEEYYRKQRHGAIQAEDAVVVEMVLEEGERLHDGEHRHVRHACRHAAHYATYLRRINLSNHDPGYNQIPQGTRYDEDEDTSDGYPGVLRRQVVVSPELHEVHVDRQDYHRDAAAESRDKGEHSSTALSTENAADYSEYYSHDTHGYCQPVLVSHRP